MRKLILLLGPFCAVFVYVTLTTRPVYATFPGTNGKIVFNFDFGDAFTINPDGSQEHQIGPPGSTRCTTWSPDGSKIACNVFGNNGPQPATANPDGSDFQFLNANLALDLFCEFWSPDGARLVCHSEGILNPTDQGLYTVRSSDGTHLVRLTATPLDGSSETAYGYSPDGSHILFGRFGPNGQGTLFSIKPDGSGTRQLSPSNLSVVDLGFFDQVGADWSPTGSQVTFAAQIVVNGRALSSALYIVNSDGTNLHQITPSSLGAISAQFAPNGRLIAFTSCCATTTPEVWVVHPDGSGLAQVTTPTGGNFALAPMWSPDSTQLIFNVENKLGQTSVWTAKGNGSAPLKVSDTGGLTVYSWGTAAVQ
jgi:Tol biopolymer transport system component